MHHCMLLPYCPSWSLKRWSDQGELVWDAFFRAGDEIGDSNNMTKLGMYTCHWEPRGWDKLTTTYKSEINLI